MELAQLISQIKVSDNGRDMDIARMIIPFVCEDTRTMGYISNCVQRFAPITDSIRNEFVSWEEPDNVTDKSIHLAYLEHNTQLQFQYIMCSTCGNYQCNNNNRQTPLGQGRLDLVIRKSKIFLGKSQIDLLITNYLQLNDCT